jgi:hypothetical protein
VPHVTDDFVRQVVYPIKDFSGNQVTLDLGKPELDLVQPGRVSRREGKMDLRKDAGVGRRMGGR